ncbi:MAG: bifunctional DNA-formamidopyrimidine glycosylase/DNA-(apurinic or apyrimidinic site) lyase [Pseudomonadota bacterium]
MPELPEVETVRNGLAPVMEGAVITSVQQNRPDLRFPLPQGFAKRLQGVQIQSLERRAKYILGHLTNNDILVMHLGMSGRFIIDFQEGNTPHAQKPGGFIYHNSQRSIHDHIIFHLHNGARIRYNDTRRFGFMTLIEKSELDTHKFFHALGVEPLSKTFTPDYLAEKALQKNTSLKAFLLNQKIIAGLGNIYVCEALHMAGLSPKRKASVLATSKGKANVKCKALVEAIQIVLQKAIAAGGSTLKDHRQADGSLGYFQHSFQVYNRAGEACLRSKCEGSIVRETQNGRSSFYCNHCQK